MCRRRSVIVAYHGIGPACAASDPHHLRVAPETFLAHLDLLAEAGFSFVSVRELARRVRRGPLPAGLAALSFDDGMEDNHSVLLPVLQARDLPATVYVTTGLIGRSNPFMAGDSGARMMTESELREVSAAGVEVGAHTVTHPDLSRLGRADCLREMTDSRLALERLTHEPVHTFAYPFCRYGPVAVAAAREAGFEAAVTCEGRGSWAPYELKRAMITGRDGHTAFLLKLLDVYQPLYDSGPGRLARRSTRGVRRRPRAGPGGRG